MPLGDKTARRGFCLSWPLRFSSQNLVVTSYGVPGEPDGTSVMRKYAIFSEGFMAIV